jgi:hypothetical protein
MNLTISPETFVTYIGTVADKFSGKCSVTRFDNDMAFTMNRPDTYDCDLLRSQNGRLSLSSAAYFCFTGRIRFIAAGGFLDIS